MKIGRPSVKKVILIVRWSERHVLLVVDCAPQVMLLLEIVQLYSCLLAVTYCAIRRNSINFLLKSRKMDIHIVLPGGSNKRPS